MNDALNRYDSPELWNAVVDIIADIDDTELRHRAAAALHAQALGCTITTENGLDGTTLTVLTISIVDEHGSTPIARLDAQRFGITG